jgi:hypothetical protein
VQKTARVQSDLLFEAMQDKGNREQAILEIQKRFETVSINPNLVFLLVCFLR